MLHEGEVMVLRIALAFTLFGALLMGYFLSASASHAPTPGDDISDAVSHPGLAALEDDFDAIEAALPLEELMLAFTARPHDDAEPGDAVSEDPGWADIRRFDPARSLRILSMYPLELTPEELARSAALNPRDIPLSRPQLDAVSGIMDLMRPAIVASEQLVARVQSKEVADVIRRGEARATGMDALSDETAREQARRYGARRAHVLRKMYTRLGEEPDEALLLERSIDAAAEIILQDGDGWASHTIYAEGYSASSRAVRTAQLPLTREAHRVAAYYRELAAEFLIHWFAANGFLSPEERANRSRAYRSLRDEAARRIGFR
jgi:hypothetical protein